MSKVQYINLFRYLRQSPIFKAYFTSVLGVFSGLLTQLLFIRELTKEVSTESFSLYAFVFQIVAYFSVLQLGLDFTISREIAINIGRKNYSGANYSYSFIKRFNKKIVYFSALIVSVISLLFWFGIGIPDNYDSKVASLLMLIFGVFQVLTFFARPYSAVLIGTHHQNVVNTNNVLINIGSTLVGYILLKLGCGLYSLPIAMSLWAFANIFLLRTMAYRNCKWIVNSTPPVDKIQDKSLFKFGIMGTLGGIAWTIESTADVLLLSGAGFLNVVGLYVIWWRFPQMLFDLAARFTTSAYPSIAAANGLSKEKSARIISKLVLIASGFAFVIACGILFWLPSFVNLWVGPAYFYDGFHSLSVLLASLIFLRIIGNCFSLSLVSMGMVNITSGFSWIQAAIKIIFGIVLVAKYEILGLVFVSVICALLQVLGLGYYLLKRSYLTKRLLVPLICMAAMIISFATINVDITPDILSFAIGALLTGMFALIFWLITILSLGYRNLLFSWMAKS